MSSGATCAMLSTRLSRITFQETLYILQNKSLIEQIERSLKTHREGTGYRPVTMIDEVPSQARP